MALPKPADLAFLHGIRAASALWVVVAHCMIWGGWFSLVRGARGASLTDNAFVWLSGLAMSAKTAVDVFMLLSGYLMQYWALRRFEGPAAAGGRWVQAFYVRRYLRIAPAFYLALLLAVVLSGPFLDGYAALRSLDPAHWAGDSVYDPRRIDYTSANLLAHVTFVFGLIPSYSFSTMLPDWSLSLEMQFYLAFPLLFVLTMRRGFAVLALFALVLSLILMRWFARLPGPTGLPGLFPEPSLLFLKLPLFLCGMAICQIAVAHSRRRVWGIAAVVALVLVFQFRSDNYAFVTAAAAGLMVWLPMRQAPWPRAARRVRGVLGSRAAWIAGDLSYSVYLFHGFALALLGGALVKLDWMVALPVAARVAIIAAAVLPATYAAAWVVFTWVEAPMNRAGHRLAAALERPAN